MVTSHGFRVRLSDTRTWAPDQNPGRRLPRRVRLRLLGLRHEDGRCFARWSPRSRGLLSLSLCILRDRLKNVLSLHCRHVKGRGGVKGAVRELVRRVGASWCVPAGLMRRETTSVGSGGMSPGGPTGCGAGWMDRSPGEAASNAIWSTSSNNCGSAASNYRGREGSPLHDRSPWQLLDRDL